MASNSAGGRLIWASNKDTKTTGQKNIKIPVEFDYIVISALKSEGEKIETKVPKNSSVYFYPSNDSIVSLTDDTLSIYITQSFWCNIEAYKYD